MSKKVTDVDILMQTYLEELDLPFKREYKFHPHRKWRFDYALPYEMTGYRRSLAIEIEGGIWLPKGRHTTGRGYQADLEKYREAALFHWDVLRFSTWDVKRGVPKVDIQRWKIACG